MSWKSIRSFAKAFRGSGKTAEACRFCFNLERELLQLREEIKTGAYSPAPYRYFNIYDPKERVISVARFRDRVVHHAVVGVLEPLFEPAFIHDSYATRKGKGSHKAVKQAQAFLKRHPFYLKIDVDRYFDHIDHRILLGLIGRKVKDGRFLQLLERIVVNSDISRGLMEGKGLPIGNLTSQFFANVYLNALDHYMKDARGEKAYLRYMDDMVVFSDTRDHHRKEARTGSIAAAPGTTMPGTRARRIATTTPRTTGTTTWGSASSAHMSQNRSVYGRTNRA